MGKLLIVAILTMMASGAQAITVNQLKEYSSTTHSDYMMGLIDGAIAMGARCGFAAGATYDQNMAIMNKYVANNPEEWGDEVGVVYLRAIIKAYKCVAPPDVTPTSKTEVRW
jgi:hypothetical protein